MRPRRFILSAKNHNKKNYSGYNWANCDLSSMTFYKCHLRGVDFSGSALSFTKFIGCDLRFTKFNNANLSHVSFINCDLTGADMTGYGEDYIRETYHSSKLLLSDSFEDQVYFGTNLTSVLFQNVNLNDAKLGITNIYGTRFYNITVNNKTDFGKLRLQMDKLQSKNVKEAYQDFYLNLCFNKGMQDNVLSLVQLKRLLINFSMIFPKELFILIAYDMVQIETEYNAQINNKINKNIIALKNICKDHPYNIYPVITLLNAGWLCDYEKWMRIQNFAESSIVADDQVLAKQQTSIMFRLFGDASLDTTKRRLLEAIKDNKVTAFSKEVANAHDHEVDSFQR